jgi:hypothetical protein
MKGCILYTLEINNTTLGMEILTEPTKNEKGSGPEFRAVVTILNPEEFKNHQSDSLDMIMASGMKQVMEMLQWKEMWEVELTNFELGKENVTDEEGMDNLQLGLMFNGLSPQGEA